VVSPSKERVSPWRAWFHRQRIGFHCQWKRFHLRRKETWGRTPFRQQTPSRFTEHPNPEMAPNVCRQK
jgi:hypothetical protein